MVDIMRLNTLAHADVTYSSSGSPIGASMCCFGWVPMWSSPASFPLPMVDAAIVYQLAYEAAVMTVARSRPGRLIAPSSN